LNIVCLFEVEGRKIGLDPLQQILGFWKEHLLLDSHSQYVLLLWASLSLSLGSVAGSSECWK
jgi:hypothetical protein